MKAIRYIATILLVTAGALHIFLVIQDPPINNSGVVMIFGIIYSIIGILLFLNMKYSLFIGIIVPLTGIIYGMAAFDPGDIPLVMMVLGIIEAAIIVLCSILAWKSRRKAI